MTYESRIWTAEEIEIERAKFMKLIESSEERQQTFVKAVLDFVSFGYEEKLLSEDDEEMSEEIRTTYEELGFKKGDSITFEEAIRIEEALDFYMSPIVEDVANDRYLKITLTIL